MARYEVLVCDSTLPYESRSIVTAGPANRVTCLTSEGTPGNIKSVQVVLDEIDFEALGITSSQVGTVFGFGFGAVVLCWAFGYVIGVAVETVRKL